MAQHAKNSLFGFGGFAVPTLIMLISYPVLINALGFDVVGVYLLSTSLSGAWAVLDFGVAAATLKFVAEDLEQKNFKDASNVIITSLVFYSLLGVLGATVIWFLSPWLVVLLSIDDSMQESAIWAFRIAGIRFAAFFVSMVFLSLLKAFQRFDLSSYVLIALSAVTFGGAALGVVLGELGLVGISLIGLVGNLIGLAFCVYISLPLCKSHGIHLGEGRPGLQTLRRIFRYGIFMALNGMAVSLVTQLQRFLISVFLGPAAVTIFSIAVTVLAKAQQALLAGFEFLVPWASRLIKRGEPETYENLRRTYLLATAVCWMLGLLCALVLYWAGGPLIGLWLGESQQSDSIADVLEILVIGFAVWAFIPTGYHLLNGLGYPGYNTIFLLLNPGFLYAILLFLMIGGVELQDFAIAQSSAMVIQSVIFMGFMAFYVLRRKVGGLLMYSKPKKMVPVHEALGNADGKP